MTIYNDAYLQETLRVVFEDPLIYKLPKGIVRFDYAPTHGWWVRVTRDGARFRKIFSDGQCESFDDGLRKQFCTGRISLRHSQSLLSTPMPVQLHLSRKIELNFVLRMAGINPMYSWKQSGMTKTTT